MKRTTGAFMLLASLGGGCISADRNQEHSGHYGRVGHARELSHVQGPYGQPIPVGYNGMAHMPIDSPVVQAAYMNPTMNTDIMQAAGWSGGNKFHNQPSMPYNPPMPVYGPGSGIVPVPGMGPPGAVAAVGALPIGATQPINARTSVRFADPAGMKITWYGAGGINDIPLEAPARYNFAQGGIYRLKISNIPARPGLELYPTLEVLPATPKTATYLAHSSVPISMTEDDFNQVANGNFLVKVIYLPDPQYQELSTLAGPNEVVSTQLEPGVDPIQEAQKRGTILLVLRLGNIDLQAPNSPAMDAPNPFMNAPPSMAKPVMPGLPSSVPTPGGMMMPGPNMQMMPGPNMQMVPGPTSQMPPNAMPPLNMPSLPTGNSMALPVPPSSGSGSTLIMPSVPSTPTSNSKVTPKPLPQPQAQQLADPPIALPVPTVPKTVPVSRPKVTDMMPAKPTTLPALP